MTKSNPSGGQVDGLSFDLAATLRRAQEIGIDPHRVMLALGVTPEASEKAQDAPQDPARPGPEESAADEAGR